MVLLHYSTVSPPVWEAKVNSYLRVKYNSGLLGIFIVRFRVLQFNHFRTIFDSFRPKKPKKISKLTETYKAEETILSIRPCLGSSVARRLPTVQKVRRSIPVGSLKLFLSFPNSLSVLLKLKRTGGDVSPVLLKLKRTGDKPPFKNTGGYQLH